MGHYLDHAALGLPTVDLDGLATLVKLADWRVVIQNLSFLSTVESYYRTSGGETVDDMIVRNFMRESVRGRALDQIANGGILASRFSLALVATVALRSGEETSGEGKFPSRDALGEILLSANDIATSQASQMTTTILAAGVSSGENAFCRLARYYLLLMEIPDSMRGDHGWRDVRAMFRNRMGFEIGRLLSLGFGFYSYYNGLGADLNERWRTVEEIPPPTAGQWILDSGSFLESSGVSPEQAHELMLSLSTEPDRFLAEPTLADRPFDFTHLKTWPLVHLGDTRFCVPVLDFLMDRLTIRAYFDMIDDLTKEEKEAFGSFFGLVVERYVHLLLEEMLGKPAGPTSRWFKPNSYERAKGGPEGPDAILIDHQNGSLVAIFVEVKSSRPRLDSATSGDLSRLRQDWNDFLIGTQEEPKAARQLDRAISDFRKGALSVPGLDPSRVGKIYPVIITLDPWPFYLDVYSEFLMDVEASNLLSEERTARLDVWSCFDLELLSPQVRSGRSLMDTIVQRLGGPDHVPLYLQISGGDPPGTHSNSPLLTAAWDRMRENMIADLGLPS